MLTIDKKYCFQVISYNCGKNLKLWGYKNLIICAVLYHLSWIVLNLFLCYGVICTQLLHVVHW